MDIVQRNFFRLLRCGAFNTHEQLEPMSVSKWERLFQYAMMHQVAPAVYEGLLCCRGQFLLHLTDAQWEQWEQTIATLRAQKTEEDEENELLRPDHLTNPLLNHRLQSILDDEKSDLVTRRLLILIIKIVRHILNEGMPIRLLMELGLFLRGEGKKADYPVLQKWTKSLRLTQMCQLEGELLIHQFCFDRKEIPFLIQQEDKSIANIAKELVDFAEDRLQDWYFTQDNGQIFVRNSNSSAMFSHVCHSARYFRYYPSETLTNFFASFAHSLSHIEE